MRFWIILFCYENITTDKRIVFITVQSKQKADTKIPIVFETENQFGKL